MSAAPLCGETRTHGRSSFVCICPPHGGHPDHHVFIKPEVGAP